jgi:3-phenylpropionate/trans-cinnamate dioxygenase ferredoxin component
VTTWIETCAVGDIDEEDVIEFIHDAQRYAIYRCPEGTFYATDGACTHEHVSLADGLVMGHIIECPKHNGRFDYRTGEGKGAPITVRLRTYPVRVEGETVFIELDE